jgi:signal peptidase II
VYTLIVAAVVVVVDQLTTTWAVHRLARGPIHLLGPLSLRLGVNTGSAFGLAKGWAPVIGALAVVAIVVMVLASRRAHSDAMAVALGLVVGGAAGNLFDRLVRHYHGGVVDFIDLRYWPTFNVADACITVGVIVLAWSLWRQGARHDDGTRSATERRP